MNSIELAKSYVPLLDETYELASLTADLDGNPELVRAGANANELIIPMLDMSGLGDYSRNEGYVTGDVTMKNETVKVNYDRGALFNVDTMDNLETAGLAFGRLAGEFIRAKVAPEIDAFRFATYASTEGITKVEGTLADVDATVKALRAALDAMDEAEVPSTERYLYIRAGLLNALSDRDAYKSKAVLEAFTKVVKVPGSRFYTKITLNPGKEDKGGYKKAEDGANINFLALHKPALIQFPKHIAPKIIEPAVNQTADGYKFGYRNVGIAGVYANKLAGVYCHAEAAAG